MLDEARKVTIIGGGITGLTIAWNLCQKGFKPIVLEREPELGGLAAPFLISGGFLEKSYHLTFKGDEETIKLCRELGIEIVWKKTRVGIFENNRVYDISTVLDLLFRFKPLSFRERVSFLRAIYQITKIKDWKDLDKINFKDWAVSTTNRNVYEKIWKPLVDKKFYDQGRDVSLAWFWGKTAHRAKSRSKLFWFLPNPFVPEEFGYIPGSFRVLYHKLAREIVEKEGMILPNCPVEEIALRGDQINKVKYGGKWQATDFVVSTIPYQQFFNLIQQNSSVHKLISEVPNREYVGAIGVILSYPSSLTSMCWTNINDQNIPFVVSIEITNLIDKQYFGGNTILYLYSYLLPGDPLFSCSDKELVEIYFRHLPKVYPHFDRRQVQEYAIVRWKYADPIPRKNFAQRIPPLKTKITNLYLCDFTAGYPYDKGSNQAIYIANKISEIILKDAEESSYHKLINL